VNSLQDRLQRIPHSEFVAVATYSEFVAVATCSEFVAVDMNTCFFCPIFFPISPPRIPPPLRSHVPVSCVLRQDVAHIVSDRNSLHSISTFFLLSPLFPPFSLFSFPPLRSHVPVSRAPRQDVAHIVSDMNSLHSI